MKIKYLKKHKQYIKIILLVLVASNVHANKLEKLAETEHFIYYSEISAADYIHEISNSMEEKYQFYIRIFGCTSKQTIEVDIYSSLKDELKIPTMINGYAGLGKIQLNSPYYSKEYYEYMKKVPLHELVHVLFNRLNNGYSERWFSEGLAEYLSDGPRTKSERNGYLNNAVQNGKIPKYYELNKCFNTTSIDTMMIAYSVTAGFIEYLVTRYGEEKLKELIHMKLRSSYVYKRSFDELYSEYYNEIFNN